MHPFIPDKQPAIMLLYCWKFEDKKYIHTHTATVSVYTIMQQQFGKVMNIRSK